MVSANSDEASAFTDDEIAGNILIMFLAGEIRPPTRWRG
jgi:cytochrome P450